MRGDDFEGKHKNSVNTAEQYGKIDSSPITVAVLEKVKKPEDGSTVLFIGCGDGRDIATFMEKFGTNYKFLAIDFDPDMVAKTKERFEGKGLDIQVAAASASALPFQDGIVDLAISVSVLHWLDSNGQKSAISEASRVLKEGGQFVTEHAVSPPFGVIRALKQATERDQEVDNYNPWTVSPIGNWQQWCEQSNFAGTVSPVERLQPLDSIEAKTKWFNTFGTNWTTKMQLDEQMQAKAIAAIHKENSDGVMYNRVTIVGTKQKEIYHGKGSADNVTPLKRGRSFTDNISSGATSPESIKKSKVEISK